MDTGNPFRPRQMRALVMLLVLLPFVPAVLTFRFVGETLKSERDLLADQMEILYSRHFDRLLLSWQPDETLPQPQQAAALENSVRQSFGPGLPVRVSREGGASFFAGRTWERNLSPLLPGWRIQIALEELWEQDELSSQDEAFFVIGATVSGLILTIGILAGWAITREMRRNELRLTSLAAVGHELKTPLAANRMLIETLQERPAEVRAQLLTEYLPLLERENRRLIGIVENFLTASRLQLPDAKFRLVVQPLEPILHEAVESMRTTLEGSGFSWSLALPETLPWVHAERSALVGVFINLIDNAIKYSEERKSLQIKAWADGRQVFVAFQDQGIGMESGQLAMIFRPFFQADAALSRRREGCGLGLSIVKNVVARHGGKISVDTKPGEGSCFTIQVRAAKNPNAGDQPAELQSPPASRK